MITRLFSSSILVNHTCRRLPDVKKQRCDFMAMLTTQSHRQNTTQADAMANTTSISSIRTKAKLICKPNRQHSLTTSPHPPPHLHLRIMNPPIQPISMNYPTLHSTFDAISHLSLCSPHNPSSSLNPIPVPIQTRVIICVTLTCE